MQSAKEQGEGAQVEPKRSLRLQNIPPESIGLTSSSRKSRSRSRDCRKESTIEEAVELNDSTSIKEVSLQGVHAPILQ